MFTFFVFRSIVILVGTIQLMGYSPSHSPPVHSKCYGKWPNWFDDLPNMVIFHGYSESTKVSFGSKILMLKLVRILGQTRPRMPHLGLIDPRRNWNGSATMGWEESPDWLMEDGGINQQYNGNIPSGYLTYPWKMAHRDRWFSQL